MKKFLFLAISAFALFLIISIVKYYISFASDYSQRPWAYSRDKAAPLLIGKWEGSFNDPDLVKKTIQLEIFLPEDESERLSKALRSRKRGHFPNHTGSFDGLVTVTSKLGKEEYEIGGSVGDEDYHKFHFKFYQAENTKRVLPNFNLNEAKLGEWNTDEMKFTAAFSFHKTDGTGFWKSSDPRFSKKIVIHLSRKK